MVFTEDQLREWNVEALRKFLVERGVPLSGGIRKDDLIRKCVFAQDLLLPVLMSPEKKTQEIKSRRLQKLKTDHIQIPLPDELVTAWVAGSSCFPDVTIDCLQNYAVKSISRKGLKEGLNLQNAQHINNVEFNNISDSLRYCFVRGQCVPQTRIGERPYNVWVCLNTETCEVLTGECNCIAGYSEACKLVFALPHDIASEVALAHNKTCTSKQQKWGQKLNKNRKIHPPSQLRDINFKRPHPDYEEGFERPSRSMYDPRPLQDRDSVIDWNKLFKASKGTASVLCFKNLHQVSHDHVYMTSSSYDPLPINELVVKCQCEEDFLSHLKNDRSSYMLLKIEAITHGQSKNESWIAFRVGVITALLAHNVIAQYKSLKPSLASTKRAIANILGYCKPPKSPPLSWGIENEQNARRRYIRQSRKLHKDFKCNETGLKLHPGKPFLGASVDGLVYCSCCGSGNLEIKCPFTHRDKNIAEYAQQANSCISSYELDGCVAYRLQESHPYYTQVQHQMFVTGVSYADFVVFLPRESCIIRINVAKTYDKDQALLLEDFYCKHVIPELFNRELGYEYTAKEVLGDILYKVVKRVDADHAQKELDQLVIQEE